MCGGKEASDEFVVRIGGLSSRFRCLLGVAGSEEYSGKVWFYAM